MAKRGAPKGNQNARKHGFYSHALSQAERVKLSEVIEKEPDRLDLYMEAANTIARLARTRYNISKEQKKSLKEAIAKVLTEIALPLGLKTLIK